MEKKKKSDLIFSQHVSGSHTRGRKQTVHPSFKNTKQFIQAVADERDEDEVIERKESRGKALDVKEDGNSSEEEIDEEASALGSVTQQQVCLAFELALRCIYCPFSYNQQIVSSYMANDFDLLKRGLGLTRVDLKSEIRSAKRKGKQIIEELQQRIANLDRHPFYNRENFKNEQKFENWKQKERADIERLIAQLKSVPPFSGNIQVRVLGAKELKDGAAQTCRPYCQVIFNRITKQTQVIEKTVEPQWNEEFNFTVGSVEDQLQVEIWDKMLIGSIFLGCVTIPLSDFQDQIPVTKWYQLQPKPTDKTKKVSGSVQLDLHLTYREGPSIETDSPATYSNEYRNINHNQNFKILMYHLYEHDRNPTPPSVFSKGKKKQEEQDDDIPAIVKWEDAAENKPYFGSNGADDTKKRNEEMKKEGPSDATKWLLNEYAMRYGVGQFYDRLVFLEMLTKPFKLSTARLDLIHEVLIEIKVITANDIEASIAETKLEQNLTTMLRKKVEHLMRNYNTEFAPDKVGRGALGIAIVILSFVSTHNSEELCLILQDYVKAAVAKTYKTFKQQALNEPIEKQLAVACGFIPAAIEHDKIVFGEEFPKELHLSQVLAERYYNLIAQEVRQYYSGKVKISPHTFDLYDRLRDLQEVIGINKEQALPLKSIFQKFIDQWLSNFIKKVRKWNQESIASDSWQPFVPTEGSGSPAAKNEEEPSKHLHSSSVVELFVSLTECRKFFNRIKDLQTQQHISAFAHAVETVIKDYIARVQNQCVEEIHTDTEQFSESVDFTVYVDLSKQMKKKLKSSEKVALIVKKELCVRINNVEQMVGELSHFCKKVDDTMGEDIFGDKSFTEMMSGTFELIKESRQEIVNAIITKMNSFIQFALEVSAQPSLKSSAKHKKPKSKFDEASDDEDDMTEIEKRSEALIAYLSTQLIVLSDNLYFPVFISMLHGVWDMLLRDIEMLLFPPASEFLEEKKPLVVSEDYRDLLPQLVDELKKFIHAEGAGLPMDVIEEKCKYLNKLLSLFDEDTRHLIQMFRDLEKGTLDNPRGGDKSALMGEAILSVLAQRKGDKEAHKFVKQNRSTAQNIFVRKHFGLPSEELLIEKHKCVNSHMNGGLIYLTTSYVCFDTFLPGDGRVVIKLEETKELKKVFDDAIKFVLDNGKSFTFSGLGKRTQFCNSLMMQAKVLDCSLALQSARIQSLDVPHHHKSLSSISSISASDNSSDSSDLDSDSSSLSGSSIGTAKGPKTTSTDVGGKKNIKSRIAKNIRRSKATGKGHARSQSLNIDVADLKHASDMELSNKTSSKSAAAKQPNKDNHRLSLNLEPSDSESDSDASDSGYSSDRYSDSQRGSEIGASPAMSKRSSKNLSKKETSSKDQKKLSKTEKKAKKEKSKEDKKATKEQSKEAKEKKKSDLKRQKNSTKAIKRFALGEGVQFIDEFKCTYVSGHLLKGRLTIMSNCVCFYSSLLAGVTKIVVPWGAISAVNKKQEKKGDAIELVTADNNFVFVGFDDREAVHQEMTNRWQAKKKGL